MFHLRVDDEDSRVWHVNCTVADRVGPLIPETGVKRLWGKQLLNVHKALYLELLGAALDHLPATVAFWNEAGSTSGNDGLRWKGWGLFLGVFWEGGQRGSEPVERLEQTIGGSNDRAQRKVNPVLFDRL